MEPHLIIYVNDLNHNPSSRTVTLKEFMTIGSDPQCSHQFLNEDLDPRHARIEQKDGYYHLKDLRSTTGSYVNGQRFSEAILSDGDLIRMGSLEMMAVLEEAKTERFPLRSRNQKWNEELQALSQVAQSDFPVLLLGPSGTGKDIIARAIHDSSKRSKAPFMSVNCSALTETLVESELFGHVKGSFTGAMSDRKGAFEAARGGTLFLDEIGDLTYGLQAKLLRALENNEIRPVGSDRSITTDLRIIAATHQNLKEKVKAGLFRLDLFYRLNVIQVTPPALENRMEDFEGLLYTFARQHRVKFSFDAIQKLKQHRWPGNIRELRNTVARASVLFPKTQIDDRLVERVLDRTGDFVEGASAPSQLPVIKEIEKQMIVQRLIANNGSQKQTATDMGMPKSTLHDRLKYYGIDPKQFMVSG